MKSVRDCQELQQDLIQLQAWQERWQLRFNPRKCNVMRAKHASRKKIEYPYTLDDTPLTDTSSTSYLGIGVELSSDFRWNKQVKKTAAKGNQTLGVLKRNLGHCLRSINDMAYKTFLRPELEYSSAVLDPFTEDNIRKLEAVQRRAARFVCNSYRQTASVSSMMNELSWPLWSKRVQPTRGWTVAAQRSTNCTHSSCPPQWGPVSTVFWAGRPSGPAGWLALLLLKAGDVETNPGPKHTRTQVWICDICHREITRKQTSLRCNHSEHWVHLRCAHIRVDQYTDTWICHLHRGSRLPHATYTSPHFPLASSKPLLHSPPTPPTPPHPKHQHTSNSPTSPPKMTNPRLPKPLTHSPPTPPTPPPAKQIHISHKTPSPSTTPRISITTRTSNAAERPVPVSSPSATNTQVTLNTTIATPTATAPPTQTQ